MEVVVTTPQGATGWGTDGRGHAGEDADRGGAGVQGTGCRARARAGARACIHKWYNVGYAGGNAQWAHILTPPT